MHRRFISFLPWVGLLLLMVLVGCGKEESVWKTEVRDIRASCVEGVVVLRQPHIHQVVFDDYGKMIGC